MPLSRCFGGIIMDFKVISIIVLVTLSGCAFVQNNQETNTSKLNFKNYALSTCIADGYKSKEIISDAAAAARGYLEFGELPLEAYTEATLLGRKYLKKTYKSKVGAKLSLMKCLDFYHSKELEALYQKFCSSSH